MIGYGKQDVSEEDCKAVIAVLQSDFLTQGPAVHQFEEAIASYCGAQRGISACNATAALHMAYYALSVGKGDLVWTSPLTFAATANAARYLQADVDFVDVDPSTWNMCPIALAEKLAMAKEKGRLPILVVPVHLTGQSCDMEALYALSKEYGFKIVEDASHCIGGSYKDDKIGSCQFSDVTVFSFHPVKIITTGEGGMATTNDPEIAQKMELFRSHGITRDASLMQGESEGPWYYQMLDIGYNYRMTDIQAALGASQLKRVDKYVSRRHEIVAIYDKAFADIGVAIPSQQDWQYSGYHLYVIRWPNGLGGLNRRQAFEALRKNGIGVNVHYIPVHLQPYYEALGFKTGDFPNAEAYYDEAITLPLHPNLTLDEIDHIIRSVTEIAQS